MDERHAVITGASIAGLSAAWWLHHTGWSVTLIERADSFRDGGQNVDIRGVAHDVLDRMDLTDRVRALNTHETATVLVNGSGGVIAELPSDGPDGATAELEILRGDLARALLDDLPAAVEQVYGDAITRVDDADDDDAVTVHTRAGRVMRADLLVVAEGVRSTTRDMVFDHVDRRDLDITMVFGTIPRTPEDDDRWRWYNAVGGRQVHLRPDNHGTTRAVLAYASTDDLTSSTREQALAAVRERYAGAGWQSPRVVSEFARSDDVYFDYLTQIRMPSWHRGRVCVVGDAAWCVTPLGGGGASLALTAGYVLAAYVSATQPGQLEAALGDFERWMRPLVDGVQKLPPGTHPLAYPKTRAAVKAREWFMKALTSPPLRGVAARMTQVADTDVPLPPVRTV